MLLADDHAMVREGMAEILSLNDDVEVVGQAAALARKMAPDVEMPVMGGGRR